MCLSYGLGIDSTAILTRLLTDESTRDFPLTDMVVLSAGTGHEWPRTFDLVSRHVLPLLSRHAVRYIQVTRRGPTEADGVDITADSRHPDQLHLVGAWTLADEMLDAGTVPQTCGDRICSAHFKGFTLDTVITAITQGRPYRHILGYAANEHARAARDARHNSELRTGEYSLIEWGWDRATCRHYLQKVFSESWYKSACTYCPFALATVDGRAAAVAQFVAEPHAGLLALAMEYTAVCLNPTQGLIRGDRLLTLLRRSPDTGPVLDLFTDYLATVPWALYEVRRTFTPRGDGRSNTARSISVHATGTRHQMRTALGATANARRLEWTVGDARFPDDTHPRGWVRRRDPAATGQAVTDAEHFFTAAPATAVPKTGPAFPRSWAAATQLHLV